MTISGRFKVSTGELFPDGAYVVGEVRTVRANPRHWRSAAACTRVAPEVFYPLDLGPSAPAVTAARRVCAGCPVRSACLTDVMRSEDPARRWGVTAGLTPDERAALFAAQRAPIAQRSGRGGAAMSAAAGVGVAA